MLNIHSFCYRKNKTRKVIISLYIVWLGVHQHRHSSRLHCHLYLLQATAGRLSCYAWEQSPCSCSPSGSSPCRNPLGGSSCGKAKAMRSMSSLGPPTSRKRLCSGSLTTRMLPTSLSSATRHCQCVEHREGRGAESHPPDLIHKAHAPMRRWSPIIPTSH